jgi:hypothetical protein
VLAPLEEAFGRVELAGAARAVEAATERIGSDSFLVPHAPPATRRRGPRRPCA